MKHRDHSHRVIPAPCDLAADVVVDDDGADVTVTNGFTYQ